MDDQKKKVWKKIWKDISFIPKVFLGIIIFAVILVSTIPFGMVNLIFLFKNKN